MSKIYVVKVGRIPGVYFSWNECKEQVHRFSNPKFKSFKSLISAEAYHGKRIMTGQQTLDSWLDTKKLIRN